MKNPWRTAIPLGDGRELTVECGETRRGRRWRASVWRCSDESFVWRTGWCLSRANAIRSARSRWEWISKRDARASAAQVSPVDDPK